MRIARILSIALLTGASACYYHDVVVERPRPVVVRPKWLPSMTGTFTLQQDGQDIGIETFEIGQDRGRWWVEGDHRRRGGLEARTGYRLEVDKQDSLLHRMSVFIELIGERREAQAELEENRLKVTARGMGGPLAKEVPYVSGNLVDFDSPLFSGWTMSRMLPYLEPKTPVRTRTIVLTLPTLEPIVEHRTFILHERQQDLHLIEVKRPGRQMPIALWVRTDGMVVRMRTWPHGRDAPPLDRRWVEGTTTATTAAAGTAAEGAAEEGTRTSSAAAE